MAKEVVSKQLATENIPLSYLDTDEDLAADSDVKVPSQKAIKAYVDATAGGGEDYSYLRGIALQNALDILEMQAADTLKSGQSANLIRDVFSDANGYLNTVDTDETSAVYIGMSYNNFVGYNIEAASYDSKSFLTNNEDTAPRGLFFKSDGTKVYVTGATNNTIYQYTLSTAWDISTASYDSKSFSVASQEGTPFGLFFKSDGTKVYIIGTTNDTIYQYTLSTAWDISTASYDSKSFSVASQDDAPTSLFFKSDGTKVYVTGATNDTIYQYTLSTAWDISTASYDSKSFSVSSQVQTPTGIYLSHTGTRVFILCYVNGAVYQYTLSTAWDISTASYDSISYSVATQDATPCGLIFSQVGHQFYIIGTANRYIYQYSSSDVSPNNKIVYVSKTLGSAQTHFQFFAWKPETTLTGNITVDVSFDGGDNYQTGIQLDTPTEIINTGTEMILKINLNKGASDGEVSLNGYGIMLWGEA